MTPKQVNDIMSANGNQPLDVAPRRQTALNEEDEGLRAYWFSKTDNTSRYQLTPAEVGRTDTIEGEIIPCVNGLHGCPTPLDALQYADGPVIWVVELHGKIVSHGDDKYAASRRTYLSRRDLTHLLNELDVVGLLRRRRVVRRRGTSV